MPARKARSRSSKWKDPYPYRGTPAGDVRMGLCGGADCGTVLYRGDRFVVLLGDVLVCHPCHIGNRPVNMSITATIEDTA
jgi:hypothetical protein